MSIFGKDRKRQKQLEKEIALRGRLKQAHSKIGRQLKALEKGETDWARKALRAKSLGDDRQYGAIKNNLRRTMMQRRMLDRQLLSLDTLIQSKDQLETYRDFGMAMAALSKGMDDLLGQTDLAKTQLEFESAAEKAQVMDERMDHLLEMQMDRLDTYDGEGAGDEIEDADLEQHIEEVGRNQESASDREIDRLLRKVESDRSTER
ncbi:MAG: hypothetical protein ABIK09_08455 [Pseudomonadota bacterium]